MGTSRNYLRARQRVNRLRHSDAAQAVRRAVATPAQLAALEQHSRQLISAIIGQTACLRRMGAITAPALPSEPADQMRKLLEVVQNDPLHPENWHRRLVNEELAKPRIAQAYFTMRRSLWEWEEFAGVRIGARTILEVIIELARDEAFPWYLAVQAMDVRRIARLTEMSFARSVRELETLAITRPARVARIAHADGMPCFPGVIDQTQTPRPIAQWVVRYRRGVPWHKSRAAWWINYDLLCGTGRVLPGFVVSPRTLSKTYQSRNRRMGRVPGNWVLSNDDDAFLAMQETMTRQGPLPPLGLRAPLWRE